MKTKLLMIAIEYYNTEIINPDDDDATTTFEIFATLQDAWKFARANKKSFIQMWLGDFNKEHIFIDENGQWNYEDFSDLYDDTYIICTTLG